MKFGVYYLSAHFTPQSQPFKKQQISRQEDKPQRLGTTPKKSLMPRLKEAFDKVRKHRKPSFS